MKTYSETQSFSKWLQIFVYIILAVAFYFSYIGNGVNIVLIILIVPLLLMVGLLFLNAKLTTQFDIQSLKIKLAFFNKEIKWEDVDLVELKKYNPLLYGYGFRYNLFEKRTIYNLQGNVGLFIDGKEKVMVGVSSKENLMLFLQELKTSYPNINFVNSIDVEINKR